MTTRVLLFLPLLAATTAAVPLATPVGKPLTCLPLSAIRESVVRSDHVIDFRAARRRIYRVALPQACQGLGSERRLSYTTSTGQLCAQDIITIFYQSGPMRGASCGLAPFQPVTLSQ